MTAKTPDELLQLVTELRKYDHVFMSVEGAHYFSEPFGFTARTYMAHANPDDPKGLTLEGGAKSAVGVSAHELAIQICEHVRATYAQSMGRGSQLRLCCDALERWCYEQGA